MQRKVIHDQIIPFLICIIGLTFFSCSKEDVSIFDRQPSIHNPIGLRFVLTQGHRQLKNGQLAPIVLRIDSTTGETWILAHGDIPKWEAVQDNLHQVYKRNPQTKKWELGIVLPDGRDINDLSKEDLIRIIHTMSRTQQIPNPNDPLGIRTNGTSGKQK